MNYILYYCGERLRDKFLVLPIHFGFGMWVKNNCLASRAFARQFTVNSVIACP